MLLTILMPTRGRPLLVNSQLRVLSTILADRDDVEVLISDNADTPQIFDVPAGLDVRVVRPERVLHTAEENLFFGYEHSLGEYVWSLGDDDTPIPHAVERLLDLCSSGRFDGLVFDNAVGTVDGFLALPQKVGATQLVSACSYNVILTRLGFWGHCAGISLMVVRRSIIDVEHFNSTVAQSGAIYAHVFAWAHALRDKQCAFVSVPLVIYRANEADVAAATGKGNQHWQRYADEANVYLNYPWTLGFMRKFESACAQGVLQRGDLRVALEFRTDGTRFPLITAVIASMFDALLPVASGRAIRPTENEVREFCNLVRKEAPELDPLLAHFESAARSEPAGRAWNRKRMTQLLDSRSAFLRSADAFPLQLCFVRMERNHWIFNGSHGWVAVPEGTPGSLLLDIHRSFDANPVSGLFADDEVLLTRKLLAMGNGKDSTNTPASPRINVASLAAVHVTKSRLVFHALPVWLRRLLMPLARTLGPRLRK